MTLYYKKTELILTISVTTKKHLSREKCCFYSFYILKYIKVCSNFMICLFSEYYL